MRRFHALTLVALAWAAVALPARADWVNLGANTADAASQPPLGHFTGTMTYTDINATSATLTIQLTNTSPPANGGFITGFVFNNPGNAISGVTSFSSTNSNFGLISGPITVNGVNGAPFGQFDVGASTGGSFEGQGSPNGGIAVGSSATFTFDLTGSGLDTLNVMSFVDTLSTGTGAGQGYQFMVVRFRGFNNGGSDKVPANWTPPGPNPGPTPGPTVPVPPTVLLGALGFSLAFLPRLRRWPPLAI